MTHPPATCELCGDTGLYSPSELPCPKGCSAEDIVDRLNDIWSTDDHERGCRGREYSCSCGFDDRTFATAKSAAEYITHLRQAIYEAEQREKDALGNAQCACGYDEPDVICDYHRKKYNEVRAKALEEAATVAECAFDDRGNSRSGHHSEMYWSDGYRDATQAAAAAIRSLKDEVR